MRGLGGASAMDIGGGGWRADESTGVTADGKGAGGRRPVQLRPARGLRSRSAGDSARPTLPRCPAHPDTGESTRAPMASQRNLLRRRRAVIAPNISTRLLTTGTRRTRPRIASVLNRLRETGDGERLGQETAGALLQTGRDLGIQRVAADDHHGQRR